MLQWAVPEMMHGNTGGYKHRRRKEDDLRSHFSHFLKVNKLDHPAKIGGCACGEMNLQAGWTKCRWRRTRPVSGIGQPGKERAGFYLADRDLFREGNGKIDQ